MVRTIFTLLLHFRMVVYHAACHTLPMLFKIYEDMVQILLMLPWQPIKYSDLDYRNMKSRGLINIYSSYT